MKLKLNTDLGGHKAGETIRINDVGGMPTDIFWRNRLKDSERDNCVTVVKSKSTKKET